MILEQIADDDLEVVLEAAEPPGAPHRALLLEHLGQRGHAPASALLEQVRADGSAPPGERAAARRALDRLGRRRTAAAHAAQPGAAVTTHEDKS
jgi:hypothetical protein